MPQVAICTENIVIPTLSAGILLNGERLEYPPEYLVQHLSVCFPLLIQPLLRNIVVVDWNRQESDHYDAVCWGHLADLQGWIANRHIYRPLFLVASKIWEMCSVGREDQENLCIPHLSIDVTSISMWFSSIISPYLCLLTPVRCLHFSVEAFRWRNLVKVTMWGVNAMLGLGWLLHQPCYAFDDISTPVFDGALVIVTPSYILESV